VVFLNPDTASPFTRIPFEAQAELLRRLVKAPFRGVPGSARPKALGESPTGKGADKSETAARVLLGEGHTDKGIGERLWLTLPLWLRDRVTLVPAAMPLATYSALIDWSDLFLSGDTGPLHIAAARKFDRGRHAPLRNRTRVFSVFGATPPRFSGYDSRQPGFLGSAQDRESRTYQSVSACRNLTCLHKMARECDAKGCFQGLDLDKILFDIRESLAGKGQILPA
jgi:hypothetical protein